MVNKAVLVAVIAMLVAGLGFPEWMYDEVIDEMEDELDWAYVIAYSDNEISGRYRNNPIVLQIDCDATWVRLIASPVGGFDRSFDEGRIKVDDENSEYVEWRIINYAENNDVAYIAPLGTKAARYFIEKIRNSQRLRVEVEPWRNGTDVAEFSTRNFEEEWAKCPAPVSE